jgi:hypothetical protein
MFQKRKENPSRKKGQMMQVGVETKKNGAKIDETTQISQNYGPKVLSCELQKCIFKLSEFFWAANVGNKANREFLRIEGNFCGP